MNRDQHDNCGFFRGLLQLIQKKATDISNELLQSKKSDLRMVLKTIFCKILTQRTYLPAGRRKENAKSAENIVA